MICIPERALESFQVFSTGTSPAGHLEKLAKLVFRGTLNLLVMVSLPPFPHPVEFFEVP